MGLVKMVLITMVAFEFFYIFYLETIATASESTSRVFGIKKIKLQKAPVSTLLKNQGVYNGLIGVILLYAVYLSPAAMELSRVMLIYIILVAIYGSLTSDKKIILTQGGLAILALISTFF